MQQILNKSTLITSRKKDHLPSPAVLSAWSCSWASSFDSRKCDSWLTNSDLDLSGVFICVFHTHFKSDERNLFLLFWLMDFNQSRIVTWQRSASWNVQHGKKPGENDQGQMKHQDRCWWNKDDCSRE